MLCIIQVANFSLCLLRSLLGHIDYLDLFKVLNANSLKEIETFNEL